MILDPAIIRLGRDFGVDWDYVVVAPEFTITVYNQAFVPKIEFRNKWLWIRKGTIEHSVTITVFKDYAFNGPTLVPDVKGTVEAAVFHDAIYQFVLEIMKAWSLKRSQILSFADDVFYIAMLRFKTNKVVANVYYWGVKRFGYIYNVSAALFRKTIK